MRKKPSVWIMCILLLVLLSSGTYASSQGQWVLVDVINHENPDNWANSNSGDSYKYLPSYSPGNSSVVWTYVGDTDTYPDPDMLNGETYTILSKCSAPPQVIQSGQEVSLDLSVSVASSKLSYFEGSGSVRAFWGNDKFVDSDGKYIFEVRASNNPDKAVGSRSGTVHYTMGAGSEEGERQSLWMTFFCANSLDTEYIYEWTTSDHIAMTTTPTEGANITTVELSTAAAEQIQTGLEDSGVRISDLWGECSIKHAGEEDDSYEYMELGMVIYKGDIIRTKDESGCILSFTDMSTFSIRPESIVQLKSMDVKESKIKLLAGQMLINVKKMLLEGTMEVEMSQAVCGIKGTTFVCTEDENGSALKVLEGAVELTSKDQVVVVVTDGQMISVKEGNKSDLKFFSALKELQSWDDNTQESIRVALDAQKITLGDLSNSSVDAVPVTFVAESAPERGPNLTLIMILAGVVLVIIALAGWQIIRKK